MITATLVRSQSTDDGTFGKFTLSTGESWCCLELPWKDNHPQTSCILPGPGDTATYTVKTINSPKHGNPTYQVQDVPNRSMVEIHSANFAGDESKGLHCQLLGCIALGKSIGILEDQQALLNSKVAVKEFMDILNGEVFELTISWDK